MRRLSAMVLPLCLYVSGASAQPAELSTCLEPGTYCSESPLDTLEAFHLDCGVTFVQFVGRLAFPPLVNRGLVTIAVRTLAVQWTPFPLYVELRGHTAGEPQTCTTLLAGYVALVAQGLPMQCGGVWETVGPLDLTQIGIPLGSIYHVQLIGFQDAEFGYGTTGFACLRVRSETSPVADVPWQRVKLLYRDATR